MEARERTGFSVGKGFLLLVPFLLFFVGVFFLSMYLYQTAVEETAFFGLVVGERAQADEKDDGGAVITEWPKTRSAIPSISYGKQFARLNVEGWSIRDIPVYLGSDKKILKRGAGMSFGSRFPGEGGCTILSAHVTRDFAELETTKVGATVLIETCYGPFTYRVTAVKTKVDGTDRWYMDAGQDADLVLYTCYPLDNGGRRRTQRCVLLCTLIDGEEAAR